MPGAVAALPHTARHTCVLPEGARAHAGAEARTRTHTLLAVKDLE